MTPVDLPLRNSNVLRKSYFSAFSIINECIVMLLLLLLAWPLVRSYMLWEWMVRAKRELIKLNAKSKPNYLLMIITGPANF